MESNEQTIKTLLAKLVMPTTLLDEQIELITRYGLEQRKEGDEEGYHRGVIELQALINQ